MSSNLRGTTGLCALRHPIVCCSRAVVGLLGRARLSWRGANCPPAPARVLAAGAALTVLLGAASVFADSVSQFQTTPRRDSVVGNTGAATYSYPIEVPPGIGGAQPALALIYNSQARFGAAGQGWSLKGIDAVSRATSAGVPLYNGKDAFVWNGNDLIYADPSNGGDGHYHTSRESFARIDHITTGGDYWVVAQPDGTRYHYGYQVAAQGVSATGGDVAVRRWSLDKVTDANGNYYTISYTAGANGDYYPTQINYTYNDAASPQPSSYRTVNLTWAPRPDAWLHLDEGARVTENQRLQTIDVFSGCPTACTRIRRYDLGYSNGADGKSLLASIALVGSDGSSSLPATKFSYNSRTGFGGQNNWYGNTNYALRDGTGTSTWHDLIDIDGDGRPDDVTRNASYENGYWKVRHNNGNGFDPEQDWGNGLGTSPQYTFNNIRDGSGFNVTNDLMDVDGDGRLDVVGLYNSSATTSYLAWARNTGSSFASPQFVPLYTTDPAPSYLVTSTGLATTAMLVDMDGNGTPDSVRRSGSGHWNANLLINGSFQASTDLGVGLGQNIKNVVSNFPYVDTTHMLIDVTGDGRPDDVSIDSSGNVSVKRNSRALFTSGLPATAENWGNVVYPALERRNVSSAGSETTLIGMVDINGDGLIDYVNVQQGCVHLNNGHGFEATCSAGWSLSSGYIEANSSYHMIQSLIDVNGDGLPDLVTRNPGDTYYTVYINTGSGFGPSVSWGGLDGNGSAITDYASGNTAQITHRLIDMDGDGLPDDVTKVEGDSTYKVHLNQHGGNRLAQITLPTGGTISYTYTGVQTQSMREPAQVVASITRNDGLGAASTATYKYENGIYDWYWHEFLGFQLVTETQPDNSSTRYNFNQTYWDKGMLLSVLRKYPDGSMASNVQYTWTDVHDYSPPYDPTAPAYKVVETILLTKMSEAQYDSLGNEADTYVSYQYDSYGNVKVADNQSGVKESKTTTDYAYNPPAWIVNKPSHVAVWGYDTTAAALAKVRESWTLYDGQAYGSVTLGKPTQVESWTSATIAGAVACSQASLQNCIKTTAGYDGYGNLSWSKDADANAGGPTNTNGHTSDIAYETGYQTLPVSVTNALNQTVSTTYDSLLRPTSVTDANGQITSTAYDVFSRVTAVIKPGDSATYPTLSYDYTGMMSGTAPSYTLTQARELSGAPGTLDSYAFIDGLGRAIQSKSEAASAGHWLTVDTWYDNMGRKQSVSVPYDTGAVSTTRDASQKQTSYAYDAMGRILTTTFADGTTVSNAYAVTVPTYDGWTTTTTDELAIPHVTVRDVYGRVTQIVESGSGTNKYTTTYLHHPATGELLTITDRSGHVYAFAYDTLGRKTSQSDPDIGSWSYGYDANGNLKSQKDAKGQTTRFSYNALNQLTNKTPASGPYYNYQYGTTPSANNVGRLQYIFTRNSAGAQDRRDFAYDARGRKTDEYLNVEYNGTAYAKSWRTSYGYDAMDRLTSTTYPKDSARHLGETVTIGYDPASRVSSVSGTDPTTGSPLAYVSNATYTPYGKLASLSYGNGALTTYGYYDDATSDPSALTDHSYRLRSLTVANGATRLLDLGYQYDKLGNVKVLTDYVDSTKSQSFMYHNLGYLLTATGVYGTKKYSYNPLGDFLTKDCPATGTCAYTYSYGSGHRVSSILLSDGVTTYAYTYDANGNVTSRGSPTGTQNFTYDALNRLIQTDVGGGETYVYGDGESRIKKITGTTVNYYVGPHYEEVWNGATLSGTTKHYFAGNQRIATRDSEGLKYQHPDHLGSASRVSDPTGAQIRAFWYDPFGSQAATSGTATVKYKYTGKEQDTTGLYYYGARYYDPVLGRFLSADSLLQDVYDPQSLNRYAYVRNNPIKLVDPDGHAYAAPIGPEAGDGSAEPLDWMGLALDVVPGGLGAKGAIGAGKMIVEASSGPAIRAALKTAGKDAIKDLRYSGTAAFATGGTISAANEAIHDRPVTTEKVLVGGATSLAYAGLSKATLGTFQKALGVPAHSAAMARSEFLGQWLISDFLVEANSGWHATDSQRIMAGIAGQTVAHQRYTHWTKDYLPSM